jgi:predicted ABC-type ATPase
VSCWDYIHACQDGYLSGTPDDAACPQCDRLKAVNADLLAACIKAKAHLLADTKAGEEAVRMILAAIARAKGGAL